MNRLRVRPLTQDERTELERWIRSGETAWYQRARTILLASDEEASGEHIARVLGLHANTTRRWMHAFNEGGVQALAPKPKGGRAKQVGEDVAETVIALRHEPPEVHGRATDRWTLQDVATVLVQEGKVEQISIETVRRLRKGRTRSWQRAKEWSNRPDPRYAVKKSGATGCLLG